MATLTIRLSDEKHARLRQLAERRRISVNKLIDEIEQKRHLARVRGADKQAPDASGKLPATPSTAAADIIQNRMRLKPLRFLLRDSSSSWYMR